MTKVFDYLYNKYPSLYENGLISFELLYDLLNNYHTLESKGDYENIKLLGLNDIKKDIRMLNYVYVEDYYNEIRIKKLKRILK